jgi:uncharacterized membrane protein
MHGEIWLSLREIPRSFAASVLGVLFVPLLLDKMCADFRVMETASQKLSDFIIAQVRAKFCDIFNFFLLKSAKNSENRV